MLGRLWRPCQGKGCCVVNVRNAVDLRIGYQSRSRVKKPLCVKQEDRWTERERGSGYFVMYWFSLGSPCSTMTGMANERGEL